MLYPLSYGGIMGRHSTPDPLFHLPARNAPLSKILLLLVVLAGAAYLVFRWAGRGEVPAVGGPAPGFELKDAAGRMRRLEDYAGHWLVLYFYPRDETPGCTAQACNLRDGYSEFQRRNVALLGISLDDPASHAAFAKNHGLPFTLLSDPDGRMADAYGALWALGPIRFAKRHTYLIDPQGRIARTFLSVNPGSHTADLLAEIDRIGLEPHAVGTNNPDIPLR
jgi:thioredoxin-dependent peroxiredoxin